MQEADEQDTCRICSAPAEHDQPLFHPCKCSGTIRYIHQDCLTTWLAHSKKKNCDVCKHPYLFTKVYAPDMPSTLPLFLLIRRLAQHIFLAILFLLRGIVVATIWLGVLPLVTVWTWRMYFSMGESTAWWISDRPRSSQDENQSILDNILSETMVPQPRSFPARWMAHPLWLSLSADIFTGQMIASLIVLTFIAVFLLREWISQNARPGVFEEEEALLDEPRAIQPPPHPPPLQVAAPPQLQAPVPVPLPQNQLNTIQVVNEPQNQRVGSIDIDPDRWFTPQTAPIPPTQDRRQKKKSRARHSDIEDDRQSRHRPRILDSEDESSPQQRELIKRKMFHRRIHVARTTAARRRGSTLQDASAPLAVPEQRTTFKFTFKAPSAPLPPDESFHVKSSIPSGPTNANNNSASSPFPSVALQPPTADIPFSLRRWQQTASNGSGFSVSQSYPPRPVLPAASRPPQTSGFNSPFVFLPGRTTDSPSLASYRPPEELQAEAGPSNSSGYLNQSTEYFNDEVDQAFEAVGEEPEEHIFGRLGPEHGKYFRNPDDTASEEDRLSLQEFLDIDFEGDIGELEAADDSIRRYDGPAAVDDDEEDEDEDEEDDDGLFREGEDEEPVGGEELFDQWDENEAGAEAIRPQAVPMGAALARAGNQVGEAAPAAAAVADNEEANVEDDMEGAMEAIGMRGPIYGVVQNAALMIFVLDTAIGLGIWIPFTVGKTTALLTLDPRRFLQVLHLPIRGMRLITDPIVDSVVYLIVKLLFPRLTGMVQGVLRLFMHFVTRSARGLLGSNTTSDISGFSAKIYNHSADLMGAPIGHLSVWTLASNLTVASEPSNSTRAFMSSIPDHLGFTEPYFAILGSKIRLLGTQVQSTWIRLALGSGPVNRVFAVCLGYVVVCLLFSLYLNILTVGNARSAGIFVRNAVRQQLLVLKVATFIFIELVTFPLGCGVVLDLCTVWLFPEANMQSRASFFVQAPLTAMFYHWVAGTMFMYSFAVLLSGCRSVIRPGAMWFIKDPQDQNSHPIRDILDRPTFTQLRKIGVSGVMYSFVVVCVVSSVAALLVLGSKSSITPFRWRNREPLSNVPIDLLFLHLVLPYTMQYFRPKRAIKNVATFVWKSLARRFRLSSYFFGGRYHEEEYTSKSWRGLLFQPSMEMPDVDDTPDGSFRRVPAADNIALPRDMRATVAVTETGEPVDNDARKLMDLQDVEATKAKRSIKDDYMIVYLPPFFRYRVIGFITLLWMFGAIFIGFAVALPIQLGRSFFKLFTSREVHDGYSFIIGFCLVWMCYLFAKAIDRLDKRRQRRGGDGPRADLYILVLKRGLLWAAKITYMMLSMGIVIPILLAVVIDLYIIFPIRFSLDPTLTPRIRIVDTWALGLLYAKIAFHAHRIQPPNRITRGIQHILIHGWTRPDPVSATKEVIGPLAGGLLGMILFPGLVFHMAQYFLPNVSLDNRFVFMHVYPTVFVFAATIRSCIVLFDLLSSWSQSIRDKEFLVEMKLRNHEPELENVLEKDEEARNEEIRPPLGVEEAHNP